MVRRIKKLYISLATAVFELTIINSSHSLQIESVRATFMRADLISTRIWSGKEID